MIQQPAYRGQFASWVWFGFALLAAATVYAAVRIRRDRGENDAGIFAGAAMVAGIASYTAFSFDAVQQTNVWYCMPLMAFVGSLPPPPKEYPKACRRFQ